jgi:hypothetical protein
MPTQTALTLRFPEEQLAVLTARYVVNDEPAITAGRQARERGYLHLEDFMAISDWKFPYGHESHCRNSEETIHRRTQWSLTANDEEATIRSLMLLGGVSWSLGSVLLHFAHPEPYPIMDAAALFSLNGPADQHPTLPFWLEYVRACRTIADDHKISMRDLDRALWQYAQEYKLDEKMKYRPLAHARVSARG